MDQGKKFFLSVSVVDDTEPAVRVSGQVLLKFVWRVLCETLLKNAHGQCPKPSLTFIPDSIVSVADVRQSTFRIAIDEKRFVDDLYSSNIFHMSPTSLA